MKKSFTHTTESSAIPASSGIFQIRPFIASSPCSVLALYIMFTKSWLCVPQSQLAIDNPTPLP
jgi:hypothetical protein